MHSVPLQRAHNHGGREVAHHGVTKGRHQRGDDDAGVVASAGQQAGADLAQGGGGGLGDERLSRGRRVSDSVAGQLQNHSGQLLNREHGRHVGEHHLHTAGGQENRSGANAHEVSVASKIHRETPAMAQEPGG